MTTCAHQLEIIHRSGSAVVRWCRFCGAVVVDAEIDGHTQPGSIMPMKHVQGLRRCECENHHPVNVVDVCCNCGGYRP